MHTLQVECSNTIYERLMFFLNSLPKGEAVIYELDDIPNDETMQAMSEVKNGQTTVIHNFDDYLAQMNTDVHTKKN